MEGGGAGVELGWCVEGWGLAGIIANNCDGATHSKIKLGARRLGGQGSCSPLCRMNHHV